LSVKVSLKDGTGSGVEACVKEVGTLEPPEKALCVNISGTSPGQSLTTLDSVGGNQKDFFLTQETSPGSGIPDGVTQNAAVEGTLGSPINFRFNALPEFDLVVTDIIIVGLDVGLKINNWIGSNSALTNGCNLTIKANDDPEIMVNFKRTRDLISWSSLGGDVIYSESGGDMVKAIRQYVPLLVIRSENTHGTLPESDDYVQWTVQDSHAGINEVTIELRGFVAEPGTI
jgi:hypothetical protein